MDEAYAVGVRLVLDDAMTPALAFMQRQLGDFDRAVGASAQGLAGFARLPVPAAPAPPAPVAVPDLPVLASPAQPVTSAEPVVPQALRPVRETPAPLAPLAMPVPAVERVEVPRLITSQAVPAAPAAAPVAPVAPAPAPVRQVLADFATFAPRQAAPERLASPAPELSLLAPVPLPASVASLAPRVEEQVRVPAAPMPREETQIQSRTKPEDQSVLPRSGPPGEQAQSAAGGPTTGDVFLDGMRVGRWMARELARQADAPQAGTTFFDPRAGTSWPGTMQGQ